MHKLSSFTIPASVVILVLLPLVCSSQEHERTHKRHTSKKQSMHELTHQLLFEITLHGFLLWSSMGFLMPVGILAIRMSNREECVKRLRIMFYIHASLQSLSVLLATAGAIMSIRNFENSFNNVHQRMGLVLYGSMWLQALIGFLRPHRGCKERSVWFFVHWLLGTSVSVLGVVSVYTGLQAYQKKTSRSIRLWTIMFTAEISFIAFFYLFQDKWEYIQKQGVILGNKPVQPTDQGISPRDSKDKEPLNESC